MWVRKGTVDELERCERNRRGQPLGEGPTNRGSGTQLKVFRARGGHAGSRRRAEITLARSSPSLTSPRASSASDPASRRRVSGFPRIASVSCRVSRSSTAIRTADGRPRAAYPKYLASRWLRTRPTTFGGTDGQ